MREEIIKMAREAGFEEALEDTLKGETLVWTAEPKHLERFFHMAQAAECANWPAEMEAMERQVNILTDELAKAVAAEREACAKEIENYALGYSEPTWAFKLTSIIRARGQTHD